MRSIMAALLALAVLFSGCSGQESALPSNTAQNPDGMEGDLYADFSFPESTDTLTVYNLHYSDPVGPQMMLEPAVEIFRTLYPDVNVEVVNYGNSQFEYIMRTELAAGKGPDLVFCHVNYMPDIEKTMSTLIFEDLRPYFEKDDEISRDIFIGNTAEIGVWRGKQYFVPLAHRFSILVTTRELLDEFGIDTALPETFDGFLEACALFHERKPGKNFLVVTGTRDSNVENLNSFYKYGGLHFIDYDRNTVSVDTDRFLDILDLCRLFWRDSPYKIDLNAYNDLYNCYVCLKQRDCLFTDMGGERGTILNLLALNAMHSKETTLLYTLPGINDEHVSALDVFGAIPKSTQNKLNAWRLLKILLSDEIQTDPHCLWIYQPVTKSAAAAFWERKAETYPTLLKDGTAARLGELLLGIDRMNALTPIVKTFLHDDMQPYLAGEKSFDACLENLMRDLDFYKDE